VYFVVRRKYLVSSDIAILYNSMVQLHSSRIIALLQVHAMILVTVCHNVSGPFHFASAFVAVIDAISWLKMTAMKALMK